MNVQRSWFFVPISMAFLIYIFARVECYNAETMRIHEPDNVTWDFLLYIDDDKNDPDQADFNTAFDGIMKYMELFDNGPNKTNQAVQYCDLMNKIVSFGISPGPPPFTASKEVVRLAIESRGKNCHDWNITERLRRKVQVFYNGSANRKEEGKYENIILFISSCLMNYSFGNTSGKINDTFIVILVCAQGKPEHGNQRDMWKNRIRAEIEEFKVLIHDYTTYEEFRLFLDNEKQIGIMTEVKHCVYQDDTRSCSYDLEKKTCTTNTTVNITKQPSNKRRLRPCPNQTYELTPCVKDDCKCDGEDRNSLVLSLSCTVTCGQGVEYYNSLNPSCTNSLWPFNCTVPPCPTTFPATTSSITESFSSISEKPTSEEISSSSTDSKEEIIWTAILAGGVVFILVFVILIACCCSKCKSQPNKVPKGKGHPKKKGSNIKNANSVSKDTKKNQKYESLQQLSATGQQNYESIRKASAIQPSKSGNQNYEAIESMSKAQPSANSNQNYEMIQSMSKAKSSGKGPKNAYMILSAFKPLKLNWVTSTRSYKSSKKSTKDTKIFATDSKKSKKTAASMKDSKKSLKKTCSKSDKSKKSAKKGLPSALSLPAESLVTSLTPKSKEIQPISKKAKRRK